VGFLGGAAGVQLLKTISPTGQSMLADGVPPAYQNKSKLEVLFGPRVWDEGHEVVELAEHGARRVIGIENYPRWFASASERIVTRGVADRCTIVTEWTGAQPEPT